MGSGGCRHQRSERTTSLSVPLSPTEASAPAHGPAALLTPTAALPAPCSTKVTAVTIVSCSIPDSGDGDDSTANFVGVARACNSDLPTLHSLPLLQSRNRLCLGALMAAAPPWQCLLDTGTWLEPRVSPVVTLDNLTAGECCSACIQTQHCATFELSAGRCHLSGNRSVAAAGTEPTRGVVLTVSYERVVSPAARLPRPRRRRRRLQQLPCLAWEPFRLGALYSSCAPQDSTARRCTDFLGAARRAACMTPQLPPARLAVQECGGRRPIALRIAQANASLFV